MDQTTTFKEKQGLTERGEFQDPDRCSRERTIWDNMAAGLV